MDLAEKLAEEERTKRQSEWSKVRSVSDKMAPSSSSALDRIDHRPLHEKLNEQRMLEEHELRERAKLSNYVRKLEFDEVEFLTNLKEEEDAKKLAQKKKEESEVKIFKRQMEASSSSSTPLVTVTNNNSKPKISKDKQKKILSSLVRKKKLTKSLVSYHNDERSNE